MQLVKYKIRREVVHVATEILTKPVEKTSFKKPKYKKTNLLSAATAEDIKIINQLTKNDRGLSSLTYQEIYSEGI